MKKKPAAKLRRMTPRLVERPAGNPDFSAVRKRINDLVAREAVGMVDGAVDAAKDGQYGAMKCLFEIVGLFPAPLESVEDPGEGLVEKLLRQLEIEEAPELESVEGIHPRHSDKDEPPTPVK